jgi:hypothetical protein
MKKLFALMIVLGAFLATNVYATPAALDVYGGFDPSSGLYILYGHDGSPLEPGDCVCVYWKGPDGLLDGIDLTNPPEPAGDDVRLTDPCSEIGANDGATGPAFQILGVGTGQSGSGIHPEACEEVYVVIFDAPCDELGPSNYYGISDQFHVENFNGETFFTTFEGTPDADIHVPVELTSFDAIARDGEVLLEWKTASETNSDHFAIERNGERLNATIDASRNSTTEQVYTYVDKDVENDVTYSYNLITVDLEGIEAIANDEPVSATPMAYVPTAFALYQNYPNPFNPTTEIRYDIPKDVHVTLKVYNILGAEVATLVDADQEANFHKVQWDAKDLASGVYFCTLTAGDFKAVKKMVFLK